MEEVDIVDNKNNVIGKTTKVDAHIQGYLHRTVIAEVTNAKSQWLLVEQASDRQDAGQLVSPVGGHVRAGESEIDALKREAFEELGLKDFTFKYINKAIYNRFVNGRRENHYFILFEIRSDEKPKLNEESVSYRWLTTEELKKHLRDNPKLFGDAFHFVWNTFYARGCHFA